MDAIDACADLLPFPLKAQGDAPTAARRARIDGGSRKDTLIGGSGSDTFFAHDRARDLANGGRGRDSAVGQKTGLKS